MVGSEFLMKMGKKLFISFRELSIKVVDHRSKKNNKQRRGKFCREE